MLCIRSDNQPEVVVFFGTVKFFYPARGVVITTPPTPGHFHPQAARMQSSSVVHLIDHDAHSFRLVVHSDSGNPQDQHFFIGGQPRPTNPSSATNPPPTATLSNMRWTKNGQALVLTSVDAATGDEMTVSRHLAAQGSVIVQHYAARRAKTGETAEAVTIFRRMVRGTSSSSSSEPPRSPPLG